MKILPAGLQDHLDSGATTLCYCWKLTLADGREFGFTDHDLGLSFDSIEFEPASGFSASAIETSVGLNVDNLDVIGALQSDVLTEADLASGRVDNAEIDIWRVNWSAVEQRVLLRKGNLGEIARGETAFVAEVRGLAHNLNQPTGRLYQQTCDVNLGSIKCGVDLTSPPYKGVGTVTLADDNRQFTASGLASYSAGWFTQGKAVWLTGANAGLSIEVKSHGVSGSGATIEIWQAMSEDILVGDTFEITAGCDKSLSTCQQKFNNILNFRGCPHMPGNDFVLSYPNRGLPNSGGSLFGN